MHNCHKGGEAGIVLAAQAEESYIRYVHRQNIRASKHINHGSLGCSLFCPVNDATEPAGYVRCIASWTWQSTVSGQDPG